MSSKNIYFVLLPGNWRKSHQLPTSSSLPYGCTAGPFEIKVRKKMRILFIGKEHTLACLCCRGSISRETFRIGDNAKEDGTSTFSPQLFELDGLLWNRRDNILSHPPPGSSLLSVSYGDFSFSHLFALHLESRGGKQQSMRCINRTRYSLLQASLVLEAISAIASNFSFNLKHTRERKAR